MPACPTRYASVRAVYVLRLCRTLRVCASPESVCVPAGVCEPPSVRVTLCAPASWCACVCMSVCAWSCSLVHLTCLKQRCEKIRIGHCRQCGKCRSVHLFCLPDRSVPLERFCLLVRSQGAHPPTNLLLRPLCKCRFRHTPLSLRHLPLQNCAPAPKRFSRRTPHHTLPRPPAARSAV